MLLRMWPKYISGPQARQADVSEEFPLNRHVVPLNLRAQQVAACWARRYIARVVGLGYGVRDREADPAQLGHVDLHGDRVLAGF
jgi:hypothetical protein